MTGVVWLCCIGGQVQKVMVASDARSAAGHHHFCSASYLGAIDAPFQGFLSLSHHDTKISNFRVTINFHVKRFAAGGRGAGRAPRWPSEPAIISFVPVPSCLVASLGAPPAAEPPCLVPTRKTLPTTRRQC